MKCLERKIPQCILPLTTSSLKAFYLIINKINGYIDERNGNKYLKLFHINIKDVLRTSSNSWDNYDGKFMKIKINLNHDLPLTKATELHNMIIVSCYICHSNKIDYSLECIICRWWYFLKLNFRFQPKVCNGCYDIYELWCICKYLYLRKWL